MVNLTALLLNVLLTIVPPGNSSYSVTPVVGAGVEGEVALLSSYYGAPVRRETADEGRARYAGIAEAAVEATAIELCRDADGNRLDDCRPIPGSKGWNMRAAMSYAFGAAILESGLREDVQVGRGKSKRPDDVGGEGRGPGGEVCLMQIHPTVAWRFVPDLSDQERQAAANPGPARDALLQSLVGRDRAALVRCFRTGIRMLARANEHCHWETARWGREQSKKWGYQVKPYANAEWAMFSMYGTGASCFSPNQNKTSLRTSMARTVRSALDRAWAAAQKS